MGRLNRLLAADLEGTRFMTMYLGVLSARDGLLRWVSAGHDPAIVYDPAARAFEEVEGGELPLGVVEDTEYIEQTYGPLRPGQIILVGTDGIWEMPNSSGEQFGKERLREAIRSAASETAAEIVESILARLTEFRGDCRQTDDVTFVVVKAVHVDAPMAVFDQARTSPALAQSSDDVSR
jgi:sigma-B regulation protein RsbU (phosphoserine phosphatase)